VHFIPRVTKVTEIYQFCYGYGYGRFKEFVLIFLIALLGNCISIFRSSVENAACRTCVESLSEKTYVSFGNPCRKNSAIYFSTVASSQVQDTELFFAFKVPGCRSTDLEANTTEFVEWPSFVEK